MKKVLSKYEVSHLSLKTGLLDKMALTVIYKMKAQRNGLAQGMRVLQ